MDFNTHFNTPGAWMDSLFGLLSTHAAAAAFLALAVALLARFVRHAAVVHTLWVVVLLKLLTPPVVELAVLPAGAPFPAIRQAPSTAVASGVASPASRPDPAVDLSVPISPSGLQPQGPKGAPGDPRIAFVLAIFGGGSFLVLVLAWVRLRRFRRRLGEAEEAPEALSGRVTELASRLGLRRGPRLRVVPARISPMILPGAGGAELLFPTALRSLLSRAELDGVLVHELAHLKRGDHWVRVLELLATVAFWWHPVVWWARYRLRQVEESSCDAWVAHVLPGQARAYAEGLLKTMEFLAGTGRVLPAVATGIDARHDMKERLTMILTRRTPRLLAPWHRWIVAAAAAALLVVVPIRAGREGGEGPAAAERSASAAEESRYRAEALELERREIELRKALEELEAERRSLAFEREMLQREAEVSHLERKTQELESAGETLAAEVHRQRQAAIRREAELVREGYEAERRLREEAIPLELELRDKVLRIQELELRGDAAGAEALRTEARAGKERLAELTLEHERHESELLRARLDNRLVTLEDERRALLESGRAEVAAKLEKEIAQLKAESEMAERHREMRSEQRDRERRLAAAQAELRALEAAGEEQAARRLRRELKARRETWMLQEQAEKLRRYEMEKRAVGAELTARIHDLEKKLAEASFEEREAMAEDLAELKKELEEVSERPPAD